MIQLSHLAIGYTLSFIGTIPLGMINMAVADTAIRQGLRAGILAGLGAALVEYFQSFIALKFTHLFIENPSVEFYFNIIATVVFLLLAAYYLVIAQPARPAPRKSTGKDKRTPFLKGMGISSLNVLVFPYWIFYGTFLTTNGWLQQDLLSLLVFCLGIMLGGFTVFFLFAKLGIYIIKRGERWMRLVNWVIGGIFLGLGIFQLSKFLSDLVQ